MSLSSKQSDANHGQEEEISSVKLASGEQTEDVDPWAISTFVVKSVPWNQLNGRGKAKRVLWDYIFRPIFLLFLIYMFICSLDFLSSAFRLLGGTAAGEVFTNSEILGNPIAGLMIGVLATVLVQSSSTSTSIVVSMVGNGLLTVDVAIFIVMGANIGTSVTNTIVAISQSGDRSQFRRAFAGATVHDMFNWLSVIILLPLEWATGYLYRLSDYAIRSLQIETLENANVKLLKAATEPFTQYVIKIDTDVITQIALSDAARNTTMIKVFCGKGNETTKCKFLFMNVAGKWDDWIIGLILLLVTLFILCSCLVLIVKLLNSIFAGHVAVLLKKFVNSDFPGCAKHFTGYVAILFGALLTILLNSSSIFTSALTPLVGIGVVTIERMYPLTLGANIGTTFTAILASLAQEGDKLSDSMQVSMCHLFFNLSGILLWYPVPFMRKIPIFLAKKLGNTTAKYRWFAGLYLLLMFFAIPALIFGLSAAGTLVLGCVLVPVAVVTLAIVVVNFLQKKRPDWLPKALRTWNFLPICCHSLKPMDSVITKLIACCPCRSADKAKSDSLELQA
ncbi:sodium-dependent phosphate transport protein 2B-like [Watersipora subatra]|uniref:sodium-dependent phosphate transport protein 2B-like n=1 Tax=Watersipora subatra TaxID=2589382 RepID=UPI00355BA1A6